MNKRNLILQAAVAAGIISYGSAAFALPPPVDLDSATPVVFAKEIIATVSAPVALTNPGSLDITVMTGYSLSPGEVRYLRMSLDNGVKFASGATVVVVPGGTGTCVVGAINGLGTSNIYFSLTADPVGNGCNAMSAVNVSSPTISITGTNTPINASFSMYDQPSQAQAGGATGRIVDKTNKPYVTFATSYTASGSAGAKVSAAVAGGPGYVPFSNFTPDGATSTVALTGQLGTLNYGLTTPTLKIDGTPTTLADLMATGPMGTKFVVTGNFAAATSVFLAADGNCSAVPSFTAVAPTATTATFTVGATPTTGVSQLCYSVTGSTAIPAKVYTAQLVAVSAAPAAYAVSSFTGLAAGEIVHDGSETIALNVTSSDNPTDATFIRVSNVSATDHGPVTAVLYAEDGTVLGMGQLVADLLPNSTAKFTSAQVATALGATTWTGRAKLKITAEIPAGSLRVQNLIRTNGILTNMGGDTSTNKN